MIRPGASLVDTLLGSVLMVAVYGFAASSVITTITAAQRAIEAAAALADISRLDAVLLEAAGRVVQPVHLPAMDAASASSSVTIGYLDGDANRSLRLGWDDRGIAIDGLGEPHHFAGVHVRAVEIASDPIPVLRLTVEYRGRTWVIAAPFGGVPLRATARPR
jgi:hypothetical protein